MKKVIIWLVVISFIASILFIGTSCKVKTTADATVTTSIETTATGTTSEATTAESQNTAEKVKLTAWGWTGPVDYLKMAKPLIEKKLPNVELDVVELGWQDIMDKTKIAATTGGEGLPDIFASDLYITTPILNSGALLDLTSYAKDIANGFPKVFLNLGTYQGKLYALPRDFGPFLFFYRKDMFDAKGINVPKTYDEALNQSQSWGQKPYYWNWWNTFDSLGYQWEQLVYSLGGNVEDANGNPTIDSAECLKAAKYISDLIKSPGVRWSAADQGFFTFQKEDGTACVQPTFIGYAGYGIRDVAPEQSGKWSVTPNLAWENWKPVTSFMGLGSWVISKNTKNPDLAWEVIKLLATDPEITKEGWQKIPHLTAYYPVISQSGFGYPDPYFGGQDLLAIAMKGFDINSVAPQNWSLNGTKIRDIAWKATINILNGEDSAKAMQDAQKEAELAIQK